jgi:hypothetical protein
MQMLGNATQEAHMRHPATIRARYGAAQSRNPGAFCSTDWYRCKHAEVGLAGLNALRHSWHYAAADACSSSDCT